ncbi:PREDICTED: protein GLE1-like [Camelina sativa]|uniref:mRNA export factor GLE1 n=1 Tax=Camelina sativa TaxID=90675 RepID=A0ABM0WAQ2_CAMSA|nr:PREDICTED: protein GLE1-like [Camelina sativa]
MLMGIETSPSAKSGVEQYRRDDERELAQEKAVLERTSVVGSSATTSSSQAEEIGSVLVKQRLKKLKELEATNQELKSRLNEDFSSFEKSITRTIRQITAVKDNVNTKINEIVKIFKDPRCPLSISIAAFAKRMVYNGERVPFGSSYVIVHVTSMFPQAMDILLAEFHKACIYTAPNHIANSDQSVWDSPDSYERLDSIMKLYGALVQEDIHGGNATNMHGIEHGWTWLTQFVNNTSTNNNNIANAIALNAFLQTAGFGLHQRYKSQFVNVVNDVGEQILKKLRSEKGEQIFKKGEMIIAKITAYLDDQMYLKEPEGRTMKTSLFSTSLLPELEQHYQRLITNSEEYKT